jgi:tRNA-dihydrouridine synthase B
VDKIAETKARLRIPVIANGDVTDVPSAVRMVEETGCDGLMIGRGAIRNPWVIRQIAQHFRGETPIEVTASERRRVLFAYLADIRARFHSDQAALGRFKKIVSHFTKGVPHGVTVRTAILRSQSIDEAIAQADAFFTWLEDRQNGNALPEWVASETQPAA